MRIVFIGTVEFSFNVLQKLIDLGANIVGVCTKASSSFHNDFADLQPLCKQYDINCFLTDDINAKETISWIKAANPDIIFCFGWSSLIRKELLSIAPMGVVGYHPAKLPQNRGRHPLIWALALGLRKSASTFFFMDECADSGDIISQVEFEILYDDNARSLYNKVTIIALQQIEDLLLELQNKTFLLTKQNDKDTNVWRKRSKRDGLVDFRMCSEAIYNTVRALTRPYVGAHVCYQGNDVKIWCVLPLKWTQSNIEPGQILESSNGNITVKTYDGAIKILEHEFVVLPQIGEYL